MYIPNILFQRICDYLLETNGTLIFVFDIFIYAKLVYLFVVSQNYQRTNLFYVEILLYS
jgi:hypothetical protein